MKKHFLILPGCDDTNRGDQALIWQTVDFAKSAGYDGDFYILADEAHSAQSAKRGIKNVGYILEHPSVHFKQSDNISYGILLKAKWAAASVLDLIKRLPLLSAVTRKAAVRLSGKSVKKSLEIFSGASAAFVKGGGFLHSNGGVADSYKIFYFLFHLRLALSMGIRVYVMPNSFGPFEGFGVKRMIRKTLSRCEIVMSREGISKSSLESECGVKSLLISDLAFHLPAAEGFDAASYLEKRGIPVKSKKCVAVTLRPYRFPGSSDPKGAYEGYKRAMADFIEYIYKRGFYPVMVEHVYSELTHEQDMVCIKEVAALLSGSCEYGIFSDRSLDCEQMKAVYGCFRYTVGTRFHSVIFSLSCRVPSIAVTYGGNKGDGIMKDMGLSEYACPISEVTAAKLMGMFDSLVENEASVSKIICENNKALARQRAEIISLIKE